MFNVSFKLIVIMLVMTVSWCLTVFAVKVPGDVALWRMSRKGTWDLGLINSPSELATENESRWILNYTQELYISKEKNVLFLIIIR